MDKVHLYVEKYSQTYQELLLDFIHEDEFFYFAHGGDLSVKKELIPGRYIPTMILVHGCNPSREIRSGQVLTLSMDRLLGLRRHLSDEKASSFDEGEGETSPATVFFEIHNGFDFSRLINDSECSVSDYEPSPYPEYYGKFPLSCSSYDLLDYQENELELCVWNVGQGNTVSISDSCTINLFDFGASIYYSRSALKKIINDHQGLFVRKKRSLVISHWHCDHYNLLCAADDTFFKNLECVFYPSDIRTMTSKQIEARIKTFCPHYIAISPKPITSNKKCGIRYCYYTQRYKLFKGHESKNPNESGLLMIVYSEHEAAFLTGDHTNYQVWNRMYRFLKSKIKNEGLLHIVVPHHGGDCGDPQVPLVPHPGIAVVSVGGNHYHHPVPEVLNEYRAAGYKVLRTDLTGCDITIRMT